MKTNTFTETPSTVERRRHMSRSVRGLAVAATVFALFLGYSVHKYRSTTDHPLRPSTFAATWVKAPGVDGYTGYFRHHLNLPSTVVNAWLKISACDGYEVVVNSDPVARQFVWRPTRPFQNGLSEKGQRLTQPAPALALNFPREYQWTGHKSHRVPVFVDIRPELHRGDNIICVQVESRTAPAKLIVEGEILLATGERFRLESSKEWLSAAVPTSQLGPRWTELGYDDSHWKHAVATDGPVESYWRSFDPAIFATRFCGHWMQHAAAAANDELVFECDWELTGQPKEAWVRLATNRYFDLILNGVRVSAGNSAAPDLDSGQWIMGRQRAMDPQHRPTILAPEELDSPFVGNRFETPPTTDPTRSDFRWMPQESREVRATTHGASSPFTRKFAAVTGRDDDALGHAIDLSRPEGVRPQSHSHDRQLGGFLAYEVSQLLVPGTNRVELRLSKPDSVGSSRSAGHVAIDGKTQSQLGDEQWLPSANQWRVKRTMDATWSNVAVAGKSLMNLSALPRLQFRGATESGGRRIRQATNCQLITVATVLISTTGLLWGAFLFSGRRTSVVTDVARTLFITYVAGSSIFIAVLLVRCSFAERHEALWFRIPFTWWSLIVAAVLFGVSVGAMDVVHRLVRAHGGRLGSSMRRIPRQGMWSVLVFSVLTMAFVTRVHQLEFQPLDDDEYASVQAILAIAESGVPEYGVEGVWYTRSPLFHYLIGGAVALFGGNVWAMRLPSVLLGVATCWLTYLFGSRLLKNRWVGMAAMVLLALHPFEIFTSHVIRFYQMQQFMAIVTLYFFCKGFVTEQSSRYRYLTVLAFLATVLCQEASCILGFSLLLGFLIFAKDNGKAANAKLVIASLCALAIIGVDYLVFQSRCMTRIAGISPNLEATIAPHFWHPANFLALFVGYSRLHIIASCFLVLGFPFVCRERQRGSLALYVILGSAVIMTNVLVTHISLRYQYWLIPVWALLSMEGLRALLTRICAYGLDLRNQPHRHHRLVVATSVVLFAACVCSLSPWRIAGSHQAKLLGDSTGAMRFISLHARPNDQVMVTEPHTHAALIETGRVDYDLSIPLLYDFAVMKDGELLDRNGGARVIGSLEQLNDVFGRHDRVWIAVNREKLRNRSKNIRWEYPGARAELFLRKNCQLVHTNYLWSVFLWDATNGQYSSFRQHRL